MVGDGNQMGIVYTIQSPFNHQKNVSHIFLNELTKKRSPFFLVESHLFKPRLQGLPRHKWFTRCPDRLGAQAQHGTVISLERIQEKQP
jgi:hypothetical protein